LLHAGSSEVRLVSHRDDDWPPRGDEATILVNATPLVDEIPVPPHEGQQVVDLAYRADGRPTALVEAAEGMAATVVDGIEILVRQGGAAFEHFTGVAAPLAVMRAAARA
jgi:shikimate 5-dehydrogenase